MTEPAPRAAEPGSRSERTAAIAELASRCGRRGHAVAFDLLRDPGDAEDAVQEALARAFAAYDELREPAALDTWFFRILVRHCLRLLKRRRRAAHIAALIPGRQPPRSRPSEHRLIDALARLSPNQQLAVVLHHGHDWTAPEIAERLGVKPSTVKTHLSRGLARLRALLGVRE